MSLWVDQVKRSSLVQNVTLILALSVSAKSSWRPTLSPGPLRSTQILGLSLKVVWMTGTECFPIPSWRPPLGIFHICFFMVPLVLGRRQESHVHYGSCSEEEWRRCVASECTHNDTDLNSEVENWSTRLFVTLKTKIGSEYRAKQLPYWNHTEVSGITLIVELLLTRTRPLKRGRKLWSSCHSRTLERDCSDAAGRS